MKIYFCGFIQTDESLEQSIQLKGFFAFYTQQTNKQKEEYFFPTKERQQKEEKNYFNVDGVARC